MDSVKYTATLVKPHNGYRNIELLNKDGYYWRARVCGSGEIITVYEDEFLFDVNP